MRDERASLQLFDLIAREWAMPSAARQITFNASGSAVAFGCDDGSVHIAATADKAAPDSRIRRAVDTGRLTIAPRSKPFPPLKSADFTEGRTSPVVAHGAQNFAFAKSSGRINTVTPGGTSVYLPPRAAGSISALAVAPDGETLAFACGAEVHLSTSAGTARLAAPHGVTALAFSPDGQTLAVAHGAGLFRWAPAQRGAGQAALATPSAPVSITWRQDAHWLVACLREGGIAVLDAAGDSVILHRAFPAPVRFAAFSMPANAVLASGAFRVAGWYLDGESRDVQSGRSGLVLVDAIAASPNRNLVAVGYANGLLSLAEIGGRAEILLREDTGAGVTALAWSADGRFLAVAGADGSAALVEFPESMFKS